MIRFEVAAIEDLPIPALDAYVARRCQVRAQWDLIRPCEPPPPSPAQERVLARGREFEAEMLSRILGLHPEAVLIPHLRAPERERLTREAVEGGAGLVAGGRLPSDEVGHRVGEPDLLVRAETGSGYRAVDIKHHLALRSERTSCAAHASSLGSLGWESAGGLRGRFAAKSREDLLQLAHYQRMLEAAGMAAEGRRAAVVGREGLAVWYDLDAAIWPAEGEPGGGPRISTMELYEERFARRLEVVGAAVRHLRDPELPLATQPVRISECDQCPWWCHCGPELSSGSGHVSLLPRVTERAYRIHLSHGVVERAGLAALHHRTARLVAQGVDVRPLLEALGTLPDGTPVAELIGRRKVAQLRRLEEEGVLVLADARALSPATAAYAADALAALPEQIDLARAALGPSPVYRRRGVERVTVPRADVEVDVDMESVEEGVYLWGTLTSNHSEDPGIQPGYLPFHSFRRIEREGELAIFRDFWGWLRGLRQSCRERRLSFRAYCYNAGAETSQMRRIATRTDLAEPVADFTRSGEWVDIWKVVTDQLISGTGMGLKVMAPLAGFAWQVADPGGAESMWRYELAVAGDEPSAAEARGWLLDYNRNDVEATRALREWLSRGAGGPPAVEALGP